MKKRGMWTPSVVVFLTTLQLLAGTAWTAPLPGGTLEPTDIPKYQAPLVIPPAMPRTDKIAIRKEKNIDFYEIAVREFRQQILPPDTFPATTVWSYGSVQAPGTAAEGGSFHYPAFTIEAKWNAPVRVKWINDLVDAAGNFLPHLLPIDQTLHWANPPMECVEGMPRTDCRGIDPNRYAGPVPIVTHVHGAHTHQESDGYPEAWYLPAALDIPAGYAAGGTFYDDFKAEFEGRCQKDFRPNRPDTCTWSAGSAIFEYPNDQRATTLWYHDHALGITRLNVYAGPAGFYLLRGGPDDLITDAATGLPAVLPGPAPALDDPPGMSYYEIPVVVQDRSFNDDGSFFYPEHRAFFEDFREPGELGIPFIPETFSYLDGTTLASDVSKIWNPEFFGNTMVVNGRTWPSLAVEPRRYRLRLLNGCNSRFLILKAVEGDINPFVSDPIAAPSAVPLWQIGAEGGFLPAPVDINAVSDGEILLGPAERADVIVDFTGLPPGTVVTLVNLGPDEPFGGGLPGIDFDPADLSTTGQVMQFQVTAALGPDPSTPVANLVLPLLPVLGAADPTPIRVSLNEEESKTVYVVEEDGSILLADTMADGAPFGPTAALLGTLKAEGTGNPLPWMAPITENPAVGSTRTWEIYNFTEDAHPIHLHLVQFQVLEREVISMMSPHYEPAALSPAGTLLPPEPWESGYKDTVIAYPGEVTRLKARFDLPGLYVWHCHILEHEDNEMMRPYYVGPIPPSLAGM